MRKSFLMRLLAVALWLSPVWAQRVQNIDMSVSGGPAWSESQVIGGTNVTLAGSSGHTFQQGFGYQIARASAASLWLDFSLVLGSAGTQAANVAGTSMTDFITGTAGLRFMVPVHERLSFYGMSGGGAGSFYSPAVKDGASPSVTSSSSVHGVLAIGGGVDVRLSRWFSLRAEVRDLVTSRGLSGATGRHHLLPTFGVAFHN